MFSFLLLLVFAVISLPSAASIKLSPATLEQETAGKSVFIKFYSPGCTHSQELAPAWERMDEEFRVEGCMGLIAEVDCMQHEEWCVQLGIIGFPTLLHGDPSHGGMFLKAYTSLHKSYEDLLAFGKKHIQAPTCSPGNIPACDPEMQEMLHQYWNMSQSELDSNIRYNDEIIRQAKKDFQDKKNYLQALYDEASSQYGLIPARAKRKVQLLKELEEIVLCS